MRINWFCTPAIYRSGDKYLVQYTYTVLLRTDLMVPLLSHIARATGAAEYSSDYSGGRELDYGYRVLADHSR